MRELTVDTFKRRDDRAGVVNKARMAGRTEELAGTEKWKRGIQGGGKDNLYEIGSFWQARMWPSPFLACSSLAANASDGHPSGQDMQIDNVNQSIVHCGPWTLPQLYIQIDERRQFRRDETGQGVPSRTSARW